MPSCSDAFSDCWVDYCPRCSSPSRGSLWWIIPSSHCDNASSTSKVRRARLSGRRAMGDYRSERRPVSGRTKLRIAVRSSECTCRKTGDAGPQEFQRRRPYDIVGRADTYGSVHIVAPPDNRPLLTTPAVAQSSYPQFLISPNGQWLLISDEAKTHVDLWEVASGRKRATFKDEGWEFSNWGCPSPDRLRLVWRDKMQSRVRATVHQFPGGSVLQSVEVPCAKGQFGYCPANDSCLLLYGSQAGKDTAWDLSTTPPAQVDRFRPEITETTSDGRYRLRKKSNWPIDWALEDAMTGEEITRAPDPERTKYRLNPFSPAFSSDNRFLLFSCMRYATALPEWTPRLLMRWYHSRGYGQQSDSVVLASPATGLHLRELSGIDLVQLAPNGDRIWLMKSPRSDSGMILEEWPIAAPWPPSWLWTFTAAGIVWYARPIWRRRFRRLVTAQTPA